MTLSVVMSTYNGERYIEKQLDSIRKQTLQPDEVIICDDHSLDNTIRIIKEYIEKNKLTRWKLIINQDNIGFYENFFKGIALSTCDIICLSDQDDIWDSNKLAIFIEDYKLDKDCTMVQSDYIFIDDKDNVIKSGNAYHNKQDLVSKLTAFDMCKFCGSGFTMSFKRIVWERITEMDYMNYKDLYVYHDILIGLMSVALGTCYLDKRVVDRHRLHKNNATQKVEENYISDRTKEKQLKILERRKKEYETIKRFSCDTDTKEMFTYFTRFAELRKELIERKHLWKIIDLVRSRECYSSKYGLITDVMYALNMEKVLLFLFKRI